MLQQITDTMKDDPNESVALSKPAELHQPQYSRPLGPNDMNEHQLRKMKLNNGKMIVKIRLNHFIHNLVFIFYRCSEE